MGKPQKRNFIVGHLGDLLSGALIGAGAILPGVSGGVLAVVFDLYRPFMELLTHPREALPRYWRRFFWISVGWCGGFLGFAQGISVAYSHSAAATIWLFVGLIAGTMPALIHEAGKEGRSLVSGISLLSCALAVFAGLFYVTHVLHFEVEPNFWWYNFCGALWGMGIVIPGFTSSSIMMALGLYQPMLDGLANLDFLVLSAALPGMMIAMLLLSRGVMWLFRRHYSVAFHGIVGIVLASTLIIVPVTYRSVGEFLISMLCAASGFLLAVGMARLDGK